MDRERKFSRRDFLKGTAGIIGETMAGATVFGIPKATGIDFNEHSPSAHESVPDEEILWFGKESPLSLEEFKTASENLISIQPELKGIEIIIPHGVLLRTMFDGIDIIEEIKRHNSYAKTAIAELLPEYYLDAPESPDNLKLRAAFIIENDVAREVGIKPSGNLNTRLLLPDSFNPSVENSRYLFGNDQLSAPILEKIYRGIFKDMAIAELEQAHSKFLEAFGTKMLEHHNPHVEGDIYEIPIIGTKKPLTLADSVLFWSICDQRHQLKKEIGQTDESESRPANAELGIPSDLYSHEFVEFQAKHVDIMNLALEKAGSAIKIKTARVILFDRSSTNRLAAAATNFPEYIHKDFYHNLPHKNSTQAIEAQGNPVDYMGVPISQYPTYPSLLLDQVSAREKLAYRDWRRVIFSREENYVSDIDLRWWGFCDDSIGNDYYRKDLDISVALIHEFMHYFTPQCPDLSAPCSEAHQDLNIGLYIPRQIFFAPLYLHSPYSKPPEFEDYLRFIPSHERFIRQVINKRQIRRYAEFLKTEADREFDKLPDKMRFYVRGVNGEVLWPDKFVLYYNKRNRNFQSEIGEQIKYTSAGTTPIPYYEVSGETMRNTLWDGEDWNYELFLRANLGGRELPLFIPRTTLNYLYFAGAKDVDIEVEFVFGRSNILYFPMILNNNDRRQENASVRSINSEPKDFKVLEITESDKEPSEGFQPYAIIRCKIPSTSELVEFKYLARVSN